MSTPRFIVWLFFAAIVACCVALWTGCARTVVELPMEGTTNVVRVTRTSWLTMFKAQRIEVSADGATVRVSGVESDQVKAIEAAAKGAAQGIAASIKP